MTTKKQIASNRRNARRSTGPKTRAGKNASSKNALRHGLLAQQVTLPDEDGAAFQEFRQRLFAERAPTGPWEEVLVDQMVACAWRLRRAERMEAAVVAHRTSEAEAELDHSRRSADPLALGLIRDATGADTMSKIGRYERRVERSMYRASHQLERLQAARQGAVVPPPAVLDIHVSSDD